MTLTKYRALVIEDEDAIRKDLVEELNSSGELVVVGEANSISTAFQLITSTQADVIFLDIKIIEGNALELITQLKHQHIYIPPLVITTGYRDFNDAEMMLNKLNDEIIVLLTKPFWKNWPIHKIRILTYLNKKACETSVKIIKRDEDHAISLQGLRQIVHILPSEIVSIRTGDKRQGKTVVYLDNSSIDCNLTLAQLMDKLPEYFIQISRFEVINSKNIVIYKQSDRQLSMKNGYVTTVKLGFHSGFLKFLVGQ